MSTPSPSPIQSHDESDWIIDESTTSMHTIVEGAASEEYLHDSARSNYLSDQDYIQDGPDSSQSVADAYLSDDFVSNYGDSSYGDASDYAAPDYAAPDYRLNEYIEDEDIQTGYDPSSLSSQPEEPSTQYEQEAEFDPDGQWVNIEPASNDYARGLMPGTVPYAYRPLRWRGATMGQALLVVFALVAILLMAAFIVVLERPPIVDGWLPLRQIAAPAVGVVDAALTDDDNSGEVNAAEAEQESGLQTSGNRDVTILPSASTQRSDVPSTTDVSVGSESSDAETEDQESAANAPADISDSAAEPNQDVESSAEANVESADAELANAEAAARTPIASAPTAAQFFVQATAALESKEWLEAATFYEEVRALDVNYQQARVEENLVEAYSSAADELLASDELDAADVEQALQYYRRALAVGPSNTAQAQSELLNNFLVGNRALRLNEPDMAVERLVPIVNEADGALAAFAAERLYVAYLQLGDEAMRAQAVDIAIDNFNEAAALPVADQSALLTRLNSLASLDLADASLFSAEAQILVEAPLVAAEVPSTTVAITVATVPTDALVEAIAFTAPEPTSLPTAAPAPALRPIPNAESVGTTQTRAAACLDERVQITQPVVNQFVRGLITVRGTATHEQFDFYKLEFLPADSDTVAWFAGDENTVQNGALGIWDSTLQPNGDYTLRLTVVDESQNYPAPCDIQVRVQN